MRSTPIRSMTPNPSSSDIWMSRRTRSGCPERTSSTAAVPAAHSPASSKAGSRARSSRSVWRASGSSSTIKVLIGIDPRDFNRRRGAASGDVFEAKCLRRAIERAQTLLRHRQADAVSGARSREARSGVANFQMEPVPLAPRDDLERPGAGALLDSMPQGIFGDRLKEEDRHSGAARLGVDRQSHLEARPESDLLDLEIALEHRKLFVEGDFLAALLQRVAEHFAQSGDHAD